MSVATQTTNGVDVNRLMAAIVAIRQNPDQARFQFRRQSSWESGGSLVAPHLSDSESA